MSTRWPPAATKERIGLQTAFVEAGLAENEAGASACGRGRCPEDGNQNPDHGQYEGAVEQRVQEARRLLHRRRRHGRGDRPGGRCARRRWRPPGAADAAGSPLGCNRWQGRRCGCSCWARLRTRRGLDGGGERLSASTLRVSSATRAATSFFSVALEAVASAPSQGRTAC